MRLWSDPDRMTHGVRIGLGGAVGDLEEVWWHAGLDELDIIWDQAADYGGQWCLHVWLAGGPNHPSPRPAELFQAIAGQLAPTGSGTAST